MKDQFKFCPKCGSQELTIEPEPGQYTLICKNCNLYCEVVVIDEGDYREK